LVFGNGSGFWQLAGIGLWSFVFGLWQCFWPLATGNWQELVFGRLSLASGTQNMLLHALLLARL
jgi:hypothetical protein